jgi:hypothetical protein
MFAKGVVLCVRVLAGSRLASKRGPARKTADPAERRCRYPTAVALPGAAKLQQLHHVPVMLRCSGAGPPARSHQSAVRTRLSSWGDFPIFSCRLVTSAGPYAAWRARARVSADPPGRLCDFRASRRSCRTVRRCRTANWLCQQWRCRASTTLRLGRC